MNYKRLIAVTAVAGMLAVTGCSANTPARNQGNRNGQRVADAVNRRPDSYANDGIVDRTTRGLNRESGLGGRYTRTPNRANTFGRPASRAGNTFQRGVNRSTPRAINDNITSNAAIGSHTMNRTERGISAGNRATRRAANRVDGIGLANTETASVFFNKTKTAPEQVAPQQEQAPAPVQ